MHKNIAESTWSKRGTFRTRPPTRINTALLTLSMLFIGAETTGISEAATVRSMDIQELTDTASNIVVATIVKQESLWRGTRIVTRHHLQVNEFWKKSDTIHTSGLHSLITLGGIVGNIGQRVPGSPTLSPGQQLVLFVVSDSLGEWHILGLNQGSFAIQAISGVPTVARETKDTHLLGPSSKVAPKKPLEALKQEVHGFLP